MSHVTGLKCVECGAEVSAEDVHYLCHECSGNLEVIYDYSAAGEEWRRTEEERSAVRSLWRYEPLLPVKRPGGFDIPIGWTPLTVSERLREMTGTPNLYLKDDTVNPTASLKDRASIIAAAKAIEAGIDHLTCASTGNAASSLAGVCAAGGLKATIFVPENAPKVKLAQMLLYGAEVYRVRGTYDHAFGLSISATERFGWYNRNSGYNPYLSEGKKTAAFEICEQLGWDPPEVIVVPVGDGCIIGGIYKGLKDLKEIGVIDFMPRLIGVQAEGAQPIVDAFEAGGKIVPAEARTVADGIAVGNPRDATKALRALNDTGGWAVSVSDDKILSAVRELASAAGVFVEPAAGAPLAGLKKCLQLGIVERTERIVLLLTGSGLKSPEAALGELEAKVIDADASALEGIDPVGKR